MKVVNYICYNMTVKRLLRALIELKIYKNVTWIIKKTSLSLR